MSPEIKFRSLKDDMSNCNFVYGSLIYSELGIPRIQEDSKKMVFSSCIKGTEGQFIGSKDENNQDIYDGDIVETIFKHGNTFIKNIAVVRKDTVNPCFVLEYKYNGNGHLCYEYDFVCCGLRKNTIIGNIHQNPELL